jgi:tRNA(Ile)-lysidine synthase
MLDKVKRTVEEHRLVAPGDRVLVAVSGGADSLTLLYALYWLRKEYALELAIAHLDHGIRGDTAEDLRVVRQAADDLGLPLIYERADVPAYADERGLNLEEAARIVRLDFLERAARRFGAVRIALGHTRTDLAETVLMHLLRGAGPGGLKGITYSTPPYIRPLLSVSRQETRDFCLRHDIPFHDDPTNLDKRYLRNAIRLELLPLLQRYNPRAEEALARAAGLLAEAEEALDWAASRALAEVREGEHLSLAALAALPPAVQALAVRAFLIERLGSPRRLERVHVTKLLELIRAGRSGEVALPGGIPAVVAGGKLTVGKEEKPREPEGSWRLPVPGEVEIAPLGWRFRAEFVPRPGSLVPPSPYIAYLDPQAVKQPLEIRPRRPGDRLRPLGLRGEKKVKNLLMEAKIPSEERDRWPLVCDQRGIVWVVGIRIAERYKVKQGTQEVLRIEADRI